MKIPLSMNYIKKQFQSMINDQVNPCLMSKTRSDNLTIPDIFRQSFFYGKTAIVLSTWFGVGLLPKAPGTFGTIAAIPLLLLLSHLSAVYKTLFLVILTAAAIWSSGKCQELLRQHDPNQIVIDEVVGFLFAMFLLPFTWPTLGLVFVLFRFFDILKPYPIRNVEKLHGGFGIVMDDLLAGVYTYVCVRIIFFFVG